MAYTMGSRSALKQRRPKRSARHKPTIPIPELSTSVPVDLSIHRNLKNQSGSPISWTKQRFPISNPRLVLPHRNYESTLRWFQPWNSRIQQQSPDSFIRMNLELVKTFSQSSQTLCHSSFGYQINQSWNLDLAELVLYYASFKRYAIPWSENCL